jgi:hypothetical protein
MYIHIVTIKSPDWGNKRAFIVMIWLMMRAHSLGKFVYILEELRWTETLGLPPPRVLAAWGRRGLLGFPPFISPRSNKHYKPRPDCTYHGVVIVETLDFVSPGSTRLPDTPRSSVQKHNFSLTDVVGGQGFFGTSLGPTTNGGDYCDRLRTIGDSVHLFLLSGQRSNTQGKAGQRCSRGSYP